MTAAWVDGVPVPVSEVDAELTRLRSGPTAALLPRDGTPDARQLRRWITQRVVLRTLLDHEHSTRALAGAPRPAGDTAGASWPTGGATALRPAGEAAGVPELVREADADAAARPHSSPTGTRPPRNPEPAVRPDPSLLGTAAADVLAISATARAVFAEVTRDVVIDEAEVRAAYERARPVRGARRLVRQAFSRDTPPTDLPAEPTAVDPATLLPEVRAVTAPTPTLVRSSLGWHLIAVDADLPAGPVPYEEVRDRLAADLLDRTRQTTFARWLDAETSTRVRLAPGYEHPADPANPDATHRH